MLNKESLNPLIQVCTEDKVHASFDMGEGEVLSIEIETGREKKVNTTIEKIEDYAFQVASTPWIRKSNALAWNL